LAGNTVEPSIKGDKYFAFGYPDTQFIFEVFKIQVGNPGEIILVGFFKYGGFFHDSYEDTTALLVCFRLAGAHGIHYRVSGVSVQVSGFNNSGI
jgi:hypothetical protein